ncbi:hypothetical protein ACIPIX_05395 [Pseudomonas protegens]|uniref:hypothetical protein n=1 Tax=Pseudomonas protegens TaxID=380021 RepID=UPI003817BD4A
MPTETQHLEQREAALHSDLNRKDEQIGALTFSDNDRELSRRSWLDEAKQLEKENEGLKADIRLMKSDLRIATDTAALGVKILAERDALLRECASEFSTAEASAFEVEMRRKIDAALSASADLTAQRVPTVPNGYCIMPRRLTAENGAKALLLGEFKLQSTHECPECRELEEPSEGCEICDGEGEHGQSHFIPWDLIKFIYSKAVEGLAVKGDPAKSR